MNVDRVNSIAFQVYTNQGDVTPYLIIDDLKIIVEKIPNNVEPNHLLLKHSPVFYLHPQEIYEPREIQSMLNFSELKELQNNLLKSSPLEINDIANLNPSYNKFMDMTNVDVSNTYELPLPEDFNNFDIKIYGRVAKDIDNFTHLQYFIFFPFQKWFVMDHEGDWEFVDVTLNSANEIESVTYAFNLWKQVFYDTSLLDFVNDTHPVVLVAKGSHNTYGRDEVFVVPFNLTGKAEYVNRLFKTFLQLDKVSKNGKVLAPEGIEGDFNYEIEEINSSTPWIGYEGYWGQFTQSILNRGVKGPKHDFKTSFMWNQIENFPYGHTPFPFIGTALYSPLDITIKDKDGNSLDYTFYTGKDEEPEVALVVGTGKYKVELDATDKGQFTLDLFYYDNESDSGIMVSYKNISNSKQTKAYVNVSKGETFILYLDYDGDGIYEKKYFPNEFISYNGYSIPDFDNDGIDDSLDNCQYVKNFDQEDFNFNGLGDECDNPKYYKELALDELELLHQANKRDRDTSIAYKSVKYSLYKKYWLSNFDIRSMRVFLYELVAVRKVNDQLNIINNLVMADKLLAEKQIIDTENKPYLRKSEERRLKKAKEFFNKGNEEFQKMNYSRAIFMYMRSWDLL
jgi:hypothetical protein